MEKQVKSVPAVKSSAIMKAADLFRNVLNKYTPSIKAPRKTGYPGHILEPMVGVEPTTYSLRVNCSTTEPHWHTKKYTCLPYVCQAEYFINILLFEL